RAGERGGVFAPDRVDRRPSEGTQLGVAVGAHFLEKKVAVDDVVHPAKATRALRERASPGFLVRRVWRARRERGDDQWQPDGGGLPLEQVATDAVDADAVVSGRDRGHQGADAVGEIALEAGEGEGAVLAAAPGDQDGGGRRG